MDRINDYFQGRLDPEQEHEMQAWLAENSDKAAVVEELECIFNSLSEQTRPETDDAFIKVTGRLGISMRRRRILKWVAGVAASVLLPFVGIGVYQAFTGTPESIVWTETRVPFGQQQKLCLSDGTILYLNSGSRITYPTSFGDKGIREIFVSGEIYAEVESDPDRPFIINSGDVGVRVLGTKFNLNPAMQSNMTVRPARLRKPVSRTMISGRLKTAGRFIFSTSRSATYHMIWKESFAGK